VSNFAQTPLGPYALQCILAAKREQEMANDGLINLVAWCKRERESLQMQREMLQSGKFRIFKNEGSGQVDTSSDSIERNGEYY
jgi:hypothetical protein